MSIGGIAHHSKRASPTNAKSTKFIANSMETILTRLIPTAVLKAARSAICRLSKVVSNAILVKIPFIIAIGITIKADVCG